MPIDPNNPDFDLLLQAIDTKNAALLVAVLLIFAVYGIRVLFGQKWSFLKSDLGGVTLAFVTSFLGAVASALILGGTFSQEMILSSVKVSFIAMGGFSAVKKAGLPVLVLLLSKSGIEVSPALLDSFHKSTQAKP